MAGMNQTIQAAQGGQMPNIMPQQQDQGQQPWMQRHPWLSMTGPGGLYGLMNLLGGSGGTWGKPAKTNQVPLYSPGVMNLKEQMPQNIMQQLMGNQFDFGPIEQQTRQNFSSQTMPSLMGRFNMGDNRASSNQFGAMSNAGQSLDTRLAAMRQGYGQQRQNMLASLLPTLMSPSFENVGQPAQKGGMQYGIENLMSMLPYILPYL
jgi:hypothetical protein